MSPSKQARKLEQFQKHRKGIRKHSFNAFMSSGKLRLKQTSIAGYFKNRPRNERSVSLEQARNTAAKPLAVSRINKQRAKVSGLQVQATEVSEKQRVYRKQDCRNNCEDIDENEEACERGYAQFSPAIPFSRAFAASTDVRQAQNSEHQNLTTQERSERANSDVKPEVIVINDSLVNLAQVFDEAIKQIQMHQTQVLRQLSSLTTNVGDLVKRAIRQEVSRIRRDVQELKDEAGLVKKHMTTMWNDLSRRIDESSNDDKMPKT